MIELGNVRALLQPCRKGERKTGFSR